MRLYLKRKRRVKGSFIGFQASNDMVSDVVLCHVLLGGVCFDLGFLCFGGIHVPCLLA